MCLSFLSYPPWSDFMSFELILAADWNRNINSKLNLSMQGDYLEIILIQEPITTKKKAEGSWKCSWDSNE